jgi:hypothetical protein
MRAPRPTLMIYNAEDDCCFRAPLVKQATYEENRPFFRIFGKENHLRWYLNTDPGYHNYQVDNREAANRFISEHFGLAVDPREIPVDAEVRTHEELLVTLPSNNLTMITLARQLAAKIERGAIPVETGPRAKWVDAQRRELRSTVRASATPVEYAFPNTSTRTKGVETMSYRFVFANGLSASGIWLKLFGTPDDAPATIVLNDKGKQTVGADVFERLFRGEQVLVVDLLFFGDAEPPRPGTGSFMRLLYTLGERPIGVQSGQLEGLASWLRSKRGASSVRLDVDGLRTQAIALVTAALNPEAFREVTIRNGISSFGHLLQTPVLYTTAPELFCLDLYRKFDLDRIEALCGPTRVAKR